MIPRPPTALPLPLLFGGLVLGPAAASASCGTASPVGSLTDSGVQVNNYITISPFLHWSHTIMTFFLFQGVIVSPGHPTSHYGHGLSCSWVVQAPPGFRIRVRFTAFQLEVAFEGTCPSLFDTIVLRVNVSSIIQNCCDYVWIHDGQSSVRERV